MQKQPPALVNAFISILNEDLVAGDSRAGAGSSLKDERGSAGGFAALTHSHVCADTRRESIKQVSRRCLSIWKAFEGEEKSETHQMRRERQRENVGVWGRECVCDRDDGHSTWEICYHHEGKLDECLGGNSSILPSQSPPPPLALFSHLLSFLHNLLFFPPTSPILYHSLLF